MPIRPSRLRADSSFMGVQTLVGVAYGLVSTALIACEAASAPARRCLRLAVAGTGLLAAAASGAALAPVLG